MHRTTALLATLAIIPFAGLTACGSDDSDGSSASADGATTATETPAAAPAATTTAPASTTAPATKPGPTTKAEAVAVCHKNFDPFIEALRKLNKEAEGPNYKHYSTLTKGLIARYGKLDKLDPYSASCNDQVQNQVSAARLDHVFAYLGWKQCREAGDDCAKAIAAVKKYRRDAVRFTNAAVKGFHKVKAS